MVPFGATSGYVTVVLAFLATRRGLSVEQGASLVAISFLPHTWKFFWAPVVDMTLSRRGWYAVSAVACIGGTVVLAALPLGPSTLGTVRVVVFAVSLAATTLGMGVEGLMAHLTPADQRGRAGGWFQAGNLGGGGIGGGLGLWLTMHLPAAWMAGAVLGAMFAACSAALWLMPDVPAEARGQTVGSAVRGVFEDVWSIARTRDGRLAALICFLPVGTGAVGAVLAQAEVAAKWGAGETEVELVNGVLSGVIMAAGCLVGGGMCRRWSPRNVYLGVGALMAAVALGMAVAPMVPATFVVGGLAYGFVAGLAYAAFTGLVLETIGAGAAATKYNIFASLSNTPITYMGLVLAALVARVGGRGILVVEAATGIAGVALFFAVVRFTGRASLRLSLPARER